MRGQAQGTCHARIQPPARSPTIPAPAIVNPADPTTTLAAALPAGVWLAPGPVPIPLPPFEALPLGEETEGRGGATDDIGEEDPGTGSGEGCGEAEEVIEDAV